MKTLNSILGLILLSYCTLSAAHPQQSHDRQVRHDRAGLSIHISPPIHISPRLPLAVRAYTVPSYPDTRVRWQLDAHPRGYARGRHCEQRATRQHRRAQLAQQSWYTVERRHYRY